MLAGVSAYFSYNLDQRNRETRSIILNDTFVLETSNRLSDALLSASRSDRKYVVLKNEDLFQAYLQARDDFAELLHVSLTRATSEEIQEIYTAIDTQFQYFIRLVDIERNLIAAARPYSADWYAEKKAKSANAIIEHLKNIRQTTENNTFGKILTISEAGDRMNQVFIIVIFFALSTGLLIALAITRSIKKPLDVMREKTVTVAQGHFIPDLEVTSPPEIAELASAFNAMCHKLQEVDTIKTDFFSHMSHELRTPLSSIKVGTAMLLEGLGGELTEKQHRILSIVIEESNRLIELVNALLDLAKMEAGMMEYQFTATELGELVKKSVDTLTPMVEAKNLFIENTVAALPPVRVDKERILQVLRNIIGNAIKFTDEKGTIKIEAHVRDDVVEVAVHDTGYGIQEKDLEMIFLKFRQVTPVTGENTKGTGLGLATARQIILTHGGKMWATSRVGKGSTFYFTLPLAA
jgi:two-component system sensor histidine kinase GlrK